ncbi:hypothetical protein Scep_018377 [Stephania cephalantha]|uniref:Uncharacterized protein n=1 Tax=Stephania cephalantha TaxID=152367 RepID=A0AAP0IRA6_9MAGN
MVLVCFVLDLRTLSPPLLGELKQCLLQLANLYAIGSKKGERQHSVKLRDRIGLCYIQKNPDSHSDELKIAYTPRGHFSLRDFHSAVNSLPTQGFIPDLFHSGSTQVSDVDAMLAKLISKEILYSWSSEDARRTVIFITSCLAADIDSLQKIVTEAADKCVTIDFFLLKHEQGQSSFLSQNIQEFVNSMSYLNNCTVQTHLPDKVGFCGLVKKWQRDLKDNPDEPLQAVFLFKNDLAGSVNKIVCNLLATVNEINDGFESCKACRCHGLPLDGSVGNNQNFSSCPITCRDLEAEDIIENVVKVGEQTILLLPLFQSCPTFQRVSAPITFHVFERTNLASLSEGVIFGASHIVTPVATYEDEATSGTKSQLNTQFFQGICLALQSLDQGLICSSNCNVDTMKEGTFQCFYILLPSENGPMLLRRLAGLEEVSLIPESIASLALPVPVQIQNSIDASLLKIKLRDYNPYFHERGLHAKLNVIVEQSLPFGSIPPTIEELNFKCDSAEEFSEIMEPPPPLEKAVEENLSLLEQKTSGFKNNSCVREEWKQLIVNEDCGMSYTDSASIPWTKFPILSPSANTKQSGDKTLRILERLEVLKQQKLKGASVVIGSIGPESCLPKHHLDHIVSKRSTDQEVTLSQPMRPNFQRLKRKQRMGGFGTVQLSWFS